MVGCLGHSHQVKHQRKSGVLFILEISQDFLLWGKMYLRRKTLLSSDTSKLQCALDVHQLCELPQPFESSPSFHLYLVSQVSSTGTVKAV